MRFDKILKIFVPTDHEFFPMFRAAIENMVKISELLRQSMKTSNPEEREKIHTSIKDLEHIGDNITDRIFEQLNKSFITPFDREDIHELTGNIDDVVDSINGISRRLCLYKPGVLKPVFPRMADLIYEAARELEICIIHLERAADKRNIILKSCTRVKEIENHADDIYFEGIQSIFENETEPRNIITHSKILEHLERCVDEEEDITDTLRSILIKMA